MANNIISNLNGKVATTSLNELLGSENLGIAMVGLSPCLGISPNAVGPVRRNRMFMASSKTRASLSLKRCREFVSRDLAGGDSYASNDICFGILSGRHGNICNKRAIRVVPRVAGRVGEEVTLGRARGASVIVIRVKNAMNSVRDLPFLRTVHRFTRRETNEYVFVRIALMPFLKTSVRLGAGPARRSMGRLLNVNVEPGIVILHARRRVSHSVGRGVTLFYGIPYRGMVRGVSLPALCRVPLTLRGRKLSGVIMGALGLSYGRPSRAS